MTKLLFLKLALVAVLGSITASATPLPLDIAYLALGEQGFWQVWITDREGITQRQITHSRFDKSSLSWYPGGQNLLVNGVQGELVKVNVPTGKEQHFSHDLPDFFDAVLSHNGQFIVFSLRTSETTDDNNIWLMNERELHGSAPIAPQRLVSMAGLQHEPRWTPDDEWIYFLSGDGGEHHDIWRLEMASGDREQLTVNNLYHFDVAVSPDNQCVFSGNSTGDYQLWLLKKSGQREQLTFAEGLDAHPSWSPLSDSMVFQSSRGGVANIWHLELSSRNFTQITQHAGGARKPVWYLGKQQGGAR
ncbi:TolB family protein [Gilvimarinus algae]|uniref:Uncharacterized protein n=1 Tax=Gilvimarinus algae TaxID=3058037 RepID=A0ABT8TG50_9GAMM|nr:hypothetical protein [Gilvimarinus sp. SDUM040014]MDO3382373.1 hypothetical protein [Gilvimarinus sp. SDUM040014]